MKYEDLQHVLCHLNISIPPCTKVSAGSLAPLGGGSGVPSLPQMQEAALTVGFSSSAAPHGNAILLWGCRRSSSPRAELPHSFQVVTLWFVPTLTGKWQ